MSFETLNWKTNCLSVNLKRKLYHLLTLNNAKKYAIPASIKTHMYPASTDIIVASGTEITDRYPLMPQAHATDPSLFVKWEIPVGNGIPNKNDTGARINKEKQIFNINDNPMVYCRSVRENSRSSMINIIIDPITINQCLWVLTIRFEKKLPVPENNSIVLITAAVA